MLIQTLAVFIVLGVIVVIHEFGHFISARSIGIAVKEFAIGLGPALYQKRGKETLFSVRCIPFGGYCLFDPEQEGVDHRGRPLSLLERGALSKMYISLAGPIMNFALAALLFTLLFSWIGMTAGYAPLIGEVASASPAEAAGLLPGDLILAIEGEAIPYWHDLSRVLREKAGEGPLVFEILRNEARLALPVSPGYDQEGGRYVIGVVLDASRPIAERVSPVEAVASGLRQTFAMVGFLLEALVQMATGQISASENLSGPLGLARTIGEAAASGLRDTLLLTAFLSVNLGIMNLLPIPALDGGKIIVGIVELVRRKRLKTEVEGWINAAGFALLIILFVVLTFKDIMQFFTGP